jgi:hypothetical protein
VFEVGPFEPALLLRPVGQCSRCGWRNRAETIEKCLNAVRDGRAEFIRHGMRFEHNAMYSNARGPHQSFAVESSDVQAAIIGDRKVPQLSRC